MTETGKYYLPPGIYKAELDVNGIKETKEFEIKENKRGGGKPSPYSKTKGKPKEKD